VPNEAQALSDAPAPTMMKARRDMDMHGIPRSKTAGPYRGKSGAKMAELSRLN